MLALKLPTALADALWAQARQAWPHECVGALGGRVDAGVAQARALYPLANIAVDPEREYLADPGQLLRALRAMQAEGLSLVALYHSHPRGPASPSLSDTQLAAYPVPYLIADVAGHVLRGYLLPEGTRVALHVGDEDPAEDKPLP